MGKILTLTNNIKNLKNQLEQTDLSENFLIEPLNIGQGITLANALRRTLLSDITGYSITGVRINGLKHEFDCISGLREDILEVILNLKQILFKGPLFPKCNNNKIKFLATLKIKGPAIITAGLLHIELVSDNIETKHISSVIEIINPSLYICTLTNNLFPFNLELDIEKGKGYDLAENRHFEKIQDTLLPLKPNTLLIDSIYMPIKKVNYKINLIHDAFGNLKESIFIEITTNGTISPFQALKEALKDLLDLIIPLFLDSEFLTIHDFFESNVLKIKENLTKDLVKKIK
jgi:DNA-directed RNA polymerase subunit alpha